MGGLVGGLFGVFNFVGRRLILTPLLGSRLAKKSWRWLAVMIGGGVSLALLGAVYAHWKYSPASWYPVSRHAP